MIIKGTQTVSIDVSERDILDALTILRKRYSANFSNSYIDKDGRWNNYSENHPHSRDEPGELATPYELETYNKFLWLISILK